MWCDLTKVERKDCDCPCVLWYNGKFAICTHYHEGKKDSELLERDQRKKYSQSGIKEQEQTIDC